MKSRKESLLEELEKISLELIDIQYRLKPGKRKPVPTIPIIYPDEQTKDPFEVSHTCIYVYNIRLLKIFTYLEILLYLQGLNF